VLVAGRRLRTERSNQYRIKNYLLRNYDKTTRPVINDSAPVNVDIAISLSHILDTVSCLLVSPPDTAIELRAPLMTSLWFPALTRRPSNLLVKTRKTR